MLIYVKLPPHFCALDQCDRTRTSGGVGRVPATGILSQFYPNS